MVGAWTWFTGCDGPQTADSGVGDEPAWSEAFDATGAGALSGVAGTGPSDVWVVGGTPEQGTIRHFDGTDWAEVPAPAVGLLVWVVAWSPDEALAVGVGGGIARWDGAAWAAVDSGTTTDLWGVWGTSPDDVWVVGGDPRAGEPVILRGDGGGFAPVPLDPAENDRLAHALFKVWGVDGRVFAVGQSGLALEWDGAAFAQLSTGADATDDFVSLWGESVGDVVAVGGRSNAQLGRFDGSTWTTTQEPGAPGLSAVATSADEVVVAGIGGWAGHLDAKGALVRERAGGHDLHAAWHDGEGRFYVVGGRFYEPYEGTALVRESP